MYLRLQNPEVGLYGSGGHMGVVLGVKGDEIIFMSANRSMKEVDGRDWDFSYAIERRSIAPKLGETYADLFFKVKV